MELIERYLQAVKRALPTKDQADILTEIRSALYDTLDQYGDQPTEAQVVATLRSMGSPEAVSQAYYPQSMYLIGPSLFPVFRLVLGIVFSAIVGIQVLLVLINVIAHPSRVSFNLFDIVNNLPAALGMVVVVFWVLQQSGVAIKSDQQDFDPLRLPALETVSKPIKRGSLIFGIIVQVWLLVFLAQLADSGAFESTIPLLNNPIIASYFPWLALTLVIDIGLDIWLLWRGYWQWSLRVARLLAEGFSLAVVSWVFVAHTSWLANAGVTGFWKTFIVDKTMLATDSQIAGMVLMRSFLAVALVVISINMLGSLYHLVRSHQSRSDHPILSVV